ncbi:MAG: TraB/GumN family protein [Chitinophagaceae bacterium]
MKKFLLLSLFGVAGMLAFSQPSTKENTLLWRISGKNITKPSYLFGTIHMICADDIELSDSLKSAILQSDRVYLELDMDNMFEMLGAISKMKMRNDTTLSDLLTPAEYEKIKEFFKQRKSILPFSMMEKFKPMLTASTLMQSVTECENTQAMEQLIMKEAKKQQKSIKGLETMAYQLSIFDSIPYQLQARQLLKSVEIFGDNKENKDFEDLTKAYRNQELDKLEEITNKDEEGLASFTELLLYNRNRTWVKKLDEMFSKNSLLIAVGAGHLPGNQGVINLLRKAGYKVQPVENKMIKKRERQI